MAFPPLLDLEFSCKTKRLLNYIYGTQISLRFGMGGTIGSTLIQEKVQDKRFRRLTPLLRTKLLPTNLTAYQSHLVTLTKSLHVHNLKTLKRGEVLQEI